MTEESAPLEAEPAAATTLFGERLPLAQRFVANLAEHGVALGLIGPRELPQLWSRHVLNSALVAEHLVGDVADVGSGGGFPGLVSAIARPELRFTLIEPMERRVAWLEDQVGDLGLANVTVVRARAEDVAGERFDCVTARAVAALRTLIPWVAPLAREGGRLLLLKGARAQEEIDAAAKVIRKHRLQNVSVLVTGAQYGLEDTRIVSADVGPAS